MPAGALSPIFRYETYADVQRNLTLITVALLAMTVILVDVIVIDHPLLLPLIGKEPTALGALGLLSLIVLVATPVAVLSVDFLQFHQRLWDDKFVHWRDHFEDGFLRALYHDHIKDVHPKVRAVLDRHGGRSHQDRQLQRTLMRELWYRPFIDEAVAEETVRPTAASRQRFFQRLTLYWATQLTEATLLAIAGMTATVRMARLLGACPTNDWEVRGFGVLAVVLLALAWVRVVPTYDARVQLDQSIREQIDDLRAGGALLGLHLNRAERMLTDTSEMEIRTQRTLTRSARLVRRFGLLVLLLVAVGSAWLIRQLGGFSC